MNEVGIYDTATDLIQEAKSLTAKVEDQGIQLPITITTDFGEVYITNGYNDGTMRLDIKWSKPAQISSVEAVPDEAKV